MATALAIASTRSVTVPARDKLASRKCRRAIAVDEPAWRVLGVCIGGLSAGERTAELGSARRLPQHFLRLVRERRARELDEWVADVHQTGPPELRGFSRTLRRDWDAVHAGLTERWSSGSVEGNVNKLKVTKRQMFSRARFDLLRKRVLLAN